MSDHSNAATVSSLTLNGMRSLEDDVWQRVLKRFTPHVSAWLLRCGVAQSDLPDQVQEVWRSVLASLPNFHRHDSGDSFGGWLHTISHRRALDYLQRRKNDKALIAMLIEEASRQQSGKQDDGVNFNSKRASQLMVVCQKVKETVRPSTWRAFEMYVIEDKPVDEVMAALNIPEHTVYTSKSRIMRRIRALIAEPESNQNEFKT